MTRYTPRDLRRVDQVALVLCALGLGFGVRAALGDPSAFHLTLLAVAFVALGTSLSLKLRALRRAGCQEPEELR